ncbi:protein PonA [Neisseria gonorrhoeae]|uniref:Protein PonA n=1 Tax=Neisseria gonorrhoeae TaxID=485 RepID=A0A378VZW2_NEIGO|nr:protein PonA [Neisseria gonorrhoeae]
MLLAYKIEQSLSKDKILELYFNQIYLGQRAYGFASAAQIYFNKNVRDLTLAEAAMLAGLPKAPSAYNPIVNPERAKLRQKYILNNMLEEKMITVQQRDQALNEELHYERFVRKSIRVLYMWRKWCVGNCMRNMVKMPIRRVLRFIPRSAPIIRRRQPRHCARLYGISIAAAATAVRKLYRFE